MSLIGPAAETPDADEAGPDPLARFRSWRGFLVAAVALNALFVWGMWGSARDPGVGAWIKALSWVPFNVIATVLYAVFMVKLAGADGVADRANTGGAFYVIVCLALIAANWIFMFVA